MGEIGEGEKSENIWYFDLGNGYVSVYTCHN